MSAARSSSARLLRRYSSAAIEGDGEGAPQSVNSTACNAKRQSSRFFWQSVGANSRCTPQGNKQTWHATHQTAHQS